MLPVFLQLTSENPISMNLLTEIDTIDIIKFLLQMKKDFLFQRQHDDVKEMLEKQVMVHGQVLKIIIVKL